MHKSPEKPKKNNADIIKKNKNTYVAYAEKPENMHQIGKIIALFMQAKDTITLTGELGTGKTTLARAIIRTLLNNQNTEIQSPAYPIIQEYKTENLKIIHADLYRITDPNDLEEIGIKEICQKNILLIEWPNLMHDSLPENRLDITIKEDIKIQKHPHQEPVRKIILVPQGTWIKKFKHIAKVQKFLQKNGYQNQNRHFMQADASTRRYERLKNKTKPAILMDMPPKKQKNKQKNETNYNNKTAIQSGITAFIAIAQYLRKIGLSAPEIYHADTRKGLAIIEDLGNSNIVARNREKKPITALRHTAIDILIHLYKQNPPSHIKNQDSPPHTIKPYTKDILNIEKELFLEWFYPQQNKKKLTQNHITQWNTIWDNLLENITGEKNIWTLRDFHSPNLIIRPKQKGLKKIGIIDFQDALIGHPAYDLVSLLQDARIDVTEKQEEQGLQYYIQKRKQLEKPFDPVKFRMHYAILGAQRGAKVLGIFSRLHKRDQKSHYLIHIPRQWAYLQRNLRHPKLKNLKQWIDTHLPNPNATQS